MTTSPCPPISDAEWPEAIAEMKTGFAGALNVYRTMAHHPALLKAWAPCVSTSSRTPHSGQCAPRL